MVFWWPCDECGKTVDEFEEVFDRERADGKRLCAHCREIDDKVELVINATNQIDVQDVLDKFQTKG